MTLLSALMEDGHYAEEAEELHDAHAGSAEDYHPIEQVIAFYRSLEIPAKLLATVTNLSPHGGDLAYMHAMGVWDGEDDPFNITSLDCSPLSCNGGAATFAKNEACLFRTLEDALNGAREFSQGNWEPGPYWVVEVLHPEISAAQRNSVFAAKA